MTWFSHEDSVNLCCLFGPSYLPSLFFLLLIYLFILHNLPFFRDKLVTFHTFSVVGYATHNIHPSHHPQYLHNYISSKAWKGLNEVDDTIAKQTTFGKKGRKPLGTMSGLAT